MVASIAKQFASKQTIKYVILENILKATVCTLLFALPIVSQTFLSLINEHIVAVKINIFVIFCLEIFSRFINPEKINLKLVDWIKCGCIVLVFCMVYLSIAVLFGAPCLQQINETFHFSLLLTVTSILPCCLSLGPDISQWTKVFALNSDELSAPTVCYITCIASIFGAWMGAFPIPLDWDRPWQVWPISCVIGTLIGYSSGLILSSIFILIKYIQLNKYKLT